jgi:hypothetical protein
MREDRAGGSTCDREAEWVEQWLSVRKDWHPASLGAVTKGGGTGGVEVGGVDGGITRAKL